MKRLRMSVTLISAAALMALPLLLTGCKKGTDQPQTLEPSPNAAAPNPQPGQSNGATTPNPGTPPANQSGQSQKPAAPGY